MSDEATTAAEWVERVNRVFVLHVGNASGYCNECACWDRDYGYEGEHGKWPCATVRLLSGDESGE